MSRTSRNLPAGQGTDKHERMNGGQQYSVNHQSRSGGYRHRSGGFSLLELMLALALGLLVVTGIVQLFVGNSRTNTVLNGQSRLQENARFAFEFISRSARTAGYFGCGPEPRYTIKGLAGNWGQIPEFDIREAVTGVEGDNPNWAPIPTAVRVYIPGNEIDTADIEANTDVLVFRSLREPVQRLVDMLQPDGDPEITAPGGDPGIEAGDIVLIANCEQGAMVRVTGRNIAGNEATLLHAVGGGTAFSNNANVTNIIDAADIYPYTLSILGRVYGPDTVVGAVESTYYYVAPSTGVDNQGNNPPALWRKTGTDAPVELIQGVEDMQVRYGIDTTLADGVNNVNQFVDLDDVPDVNQIVALRVMLTTSSVDAVTDDGDQLRRTFMKTILVRNASPEV